MEQLGEKSEEDEQLDASLHLLLLQVVVVAAANVFAGERSKCDEQ